MEKSFMQACKDFFGMKEGQTNLDFGKEVKALNPEDRKEIAEGITKLTGWVINNA